MRFKFRGRTAETRHEMRIRALLGAALMSVGVASSARAAEPSADALIVKRAPGLGAAELRERADLEAAGRVPGLARVDVVEPADGDPARALAELNADPEVRWAEPVLERHAMADDSLLGDQWGLASAEELDADIDAPEAWAITRGLDVTIAVVDTGIALAHPDLAPQLTGNPGERGQGRESNGIDDDGNGLVDDWQGWDYASDDNVPDDGGGEHGTHVAGIATAAEGGGDVVGVAPQAALLPLQALNAQGAGTSVSTAAAFAYAGRLDVRVVNASFASDLPSEAERQAIHDYPNTLFVVAAGNGGDDGRGDDVDEEPTYPCGYDEPNVVCVGASTDRDQRSRFSNYGNQTVDLFAPGQGIWSTVPSAGYAQKDGTSMAAPHVAGAAALLAAEHPNWTPERIKRSLIETADFDWAFLGRAVSDGRLNAAAALGWSAPPGEDDDAPAPGPARVATTPAGWTPPAQPPTTPPVATPPPAPQTPAPTPQAPAPAPQAPAPTQPAAPATPVVSRLRVVGRPGKRSAKLSFTASAPGQVRLVVERRSGRRYKRAGSRTLTVAAGGQRAQLGTRVAGARLKRGTWRLTLGAARVTFRVR
jgi:thermitase